MAVSPTPTDLGNFSFTEAKPLAAYRASLRTELNIAEQEAKMIKGGKFTLENGSVSTFTEVLSELVGIAPIIGQSASAISRLFTIGAKKVEDSYKLSSANKIVDISLGASSEWESMSRDLSSKLAKDRAEDLLNLSKEDAQKKAREDAKKILTKIVSGKEEMPNIDAKEELTEKLRQAALEPHLITKPTLSKQLSTHQLQR